MKNFMEITTLMKKSMVPVPEDHGYEAVLSFVLENPSLLTALNATENEGGWSKELKQWLIEQLNKNEANGAFVFNKSEELRKSIKDYFSFLDKKQIISKGDYLEIKRLRENISDKMLLLVTISQNAVNEDYIIYYIHDSREYLGWIILDCYFSYIETKNLDDQQMQNSLLSFLDELEIGQPLEQQTVLLYFIFKMYDDVQEYPNENIKVVKNLLLKINSHWKNSSPLEGNSYISLFYHAYMKDFSSTEMIVQYFEKPEKEELSTLLVQAIERQDNLMIDYLVDNFRIQMPFIFQNLKETQTLRLENLYVEAIGKRNIPLLKALVDSISDDQKISEPHQCHQLALENPELIPFFHSEFKTKQSKFLAKYNSLGLADEILSRLSYYCSFYDESSMLFIKHRLNYNAHKYLIKLIKTLDPHVREGVCYGIAMLGMQAIIVGELDKYTIRLRLLCGIIPDYLIRTEKKDDKSFENQIERDIKAFRKALQAQGKIQATSSLESALLDIPAFLDAIQLYMARGNTYAPLYEGSDSGSCIRGTPEVLALLQPVIAENDPIVLAEKITGLYYSIQEIKSCIELLSNACIGCDPISFVMGNSDHAISVGYDDKSGWTFIDANSLPPQSGFDSESLAARVFNAFTNLHNSHKGIVILTCVYSKRSSSKTITLQLAELDKNETWQNIHARYKIQQKDCNGTTWESMVIQAADTKTSLKFLDGGLFNLLKLHYGSVIQEILQTQKDDKPFFTYYAKNKTITLKEVQYLKALSIREPFNFSTFFSQISEGMQTSKIENLMISAMRENDQELTMILFSNLLEKEKAQPNERFHKILQVLLNKLKKTTPKNNFDFFGYDWVSKKNKEGANEELNEKNATWAAIGIWYHMQKDELDENIKNDLLKLAKKNSSLNKAKNLVTILNADLGFHSEGAAYNENLPKIIPSPHVDQVSHNSQTVHALEKETVPLNSEQKMLSPIPIDPKLQDSNPPEKLVDAKITDPEAEKTSLEARINQNKNYSEIPPPQLQSSILHETKELHDHQLKIEAENLKNLSQGMQLYKKSVEAILSQIKSIQNEFKEESAQYNMADIINRVELNKNTLFEKEEINAQDYKSFQQQCQIELQPLIQSIEVDSLKNSSNCSWKTIILVPLKTLLAIITLPFAKLASLFVLSQDKYKAYKEWVWPWSSSSTPPLSPDCKAKLETLKEQIEEIPGLTHEIFSCHTP